MAKQFSPSFRSLAIFWILYLPIITSSENNLFISNIRVKSSSQSLPHPQLRPIASNPSQTLALSSSPVTSSRTTFLLVASPADIIYPFTNNCATSDESVLTSMSYYCIFGNGAYFSSGNIILQAAAYVSMNNAVTQLFNTNTQFTIELYEVTTSTFQSPSGSEIFILMSSDEDNYINLFNSRSGYLTLGVSVGGVFFADASTSSFHSSATRNYAVTIDMNVGAVTLYLAGTQIAQISLPSNRRSFSSSMTIGTLNGYYANPNFRLTYAAYDEVRLYGTALSASEVLANHQNYLSQTNPPSVRPTALPTPSPTLRPTKLPSADSSKPSFPPTLDPTIFQDSQQSSGTKVPTPSPTVDSSVTPPSQSNASHDYHSSRSSGAFISVGVFLAIAMGGLLYYYWKRGSQKEEYSFCFGRGSKYQPSLYQLTAYQTKIFPSTVQPTHKPIPVLALPCSHTLCIEDLQSYLQASLANSSLFPLRCPYHYQGCTATIPLTLAKQYLTAEDYQKYLDHHERAVHGDGVRCIKCSTYIPLPDSRESKIYMVACQNCTVVFCLQCKSLNHNGKRCPADVDMEQLHQWINKVGAMKCPACQRWIEKQDPTTCNHMCHKSTDPIPCVRERTDFCYCCGEEILASHPHNEVRHPGVNHFPQGVFQQCRKILQQQLEEEDLQSFYNSNPSMTVTASAPPRHLRGNRSSSFVVPYG